MRKIWNLAILIFAGVSLLSSCSTKVEDNPEGNPSTGSEDVWGKTWDGYGRPEGVLILNQGARLVNNSSLTYITPDGTIEENVYRKVNGTPFGNEAQDMWMYNGKLYILSNGIYSPNGEVSDGELVIADAVTLKLEKAYKMKDLLFKRPEGSLDEKEWLPLMTPFDNIAVLDEKNIFLSEGQGLFRFDSTTGELNIVEGGYHFGNQGNTIEEVASTRGILRIGDHLYCGGGGFWASTRLLELSKGKNEVTRVLPDLRGDFISGICQTGEHEVMLATCGRGGTTNSYLYFVDVEKWEVTKMKSIKEDISAEFFKTSGISLAGDYIYYAAGKTTIKRLSLKTWKSETYIDVAKDAPNGKYLNCNVMAVPSNQYVYVAVSDKYYESIKADNNYLLIYDCSGDKPVLVKNIVNKTDYPIGIFPMSKFYR